MPFSVGPNGVQATHRNWAEVLERKFLDCIRRPTTQRFFLWKPIFGGSNKTHSKQMKEGKTLTLAPQILFSRVFFLDVFFRSQCVLFGERAFSIHPPNRKEGNFWGAIFFKTREKRVSDLHCGNGFSTVFAFA